MLLFFYNCVIITITILSGKDLAGQILEFLPTHGVYKKFPIVAIYITAAFSSAIVYQMLLYSRSITRLQQQLREFSFETAKLSVEGDREHVKQVWECVCLIALFCVTVHVSSVATLMSG